MKLQASIWTDRSIELAKRLQREYNVLASQEMERINIMPKAPRVFPKPTIWTDLIMALSLIVIFILIMVLCA